MTAAYLGFDPGGGQGFGCALSLPDHGRMICSSVSGVDEAMEWAQRACEAENVAPIAAGIDTLLFWQTTPSGWRGADEYLRNRYPQSRNSVLCSNGLYGSMSVQGATLAVRLREAWPDVILTETHPKVLWAHLETGIAYPRDPGNDHAATDWLSENSGQNLKANNEHEFDAALSAWAAREGVEGRWTRDLVGLKAKNQKGSNVSLVTAAHYYWPT